MSEIEVSPTTETNTQPLMVAEMSGNHQGSLDRALDIVRAAADAGADAVKIQTYTADTITLDVDTPAFRVGSDHQLWGSRRLYDLYEEAHTPWDWHAPIFELAHDLGLVAFSSPFDETAVEFLEELDVPMYKIASLEIVDLPLIRAVARTGKPVVMSMGTATLVEVAQAVEAAKGAGCDDLTLLVCTSSYPARAADAHVSRIPVVAKIFGVKVGYSDHAPGVGVSAAAVALGATLVEKHLTISRADASVDSDFSLEPDEFRSLVDACRDAALAIGSPSAWSSDSEAESKRLRPSLWVTEDVSKGDIISSTNVRSVRPSGGLAPDEFDRVVGRVFREDAGRGTPLTWSIID
jgi:pseudaminic acid synthase